MNRNIVALSVAAAAFFSTTVALAAEPTTDTPAPGAAKPADAKPADAKAADGAEHEEMRLRIGFNFGAGPVVGDSSGFTLGAGFRAGVQVNRLLGGYVQTGGSVLVASAAGTSATAIAFVPISPMVSLTPADMFEVAAGPSLDYYGGVSTTGAGSTGSFAFGIAGRLALHLGGRDATTGRRSGFAIGVDVHPIFASGMMVMPITIGLGGDWL